MKISTLTYKIAWEITTNRFLLDHFYKNADQHNFICFFHQNFFYSYPAFGKKWPDGKYSEFHKLQTCCHICGEEPERNYAGYGMIFLQRTDQERMILLCENHKTGINLHGPVFKAKQLSFFKSNFYLP